MSATMTMTRKLAFLLVMAIATWSGLAARAGTITYFHNDLSGSPVAATNAAGQVIWRESYRPYGERTVNSAAANDNKVWFTSRRQDQDTGLVYMGARYYDPVAGRFMSMDPVGFSAMNLHTHNRYAYANNNPYRYIDPDGRIAIPAARVVFTAAYEAAKAIGIPAFGSLLGIGIANLVINATGAESDGGTANGKAPQTAGEVLAPNGETVGSVEGGARPGVRTVKPGDMDSIIDDLKGLGAKPANKPNYPGDWFDLPNGQGGFGIRDSKDSGRTVDVKIPQVPDVTKIHQKP